MLWWLHACTLVIEGSLLKDPLLYVENNLHKTCTYSSYIYQHTPPPPPPPPPTHTHTHEVCHDIIILTTVKSDVVVMWARSAVLRGWSAPHQVVEIPSRTLHTIEEDWSRGIALSKPNITMTTSDEVLWQNRSIARLSIYNEVNDLKLPRRVNPLYPISLHEAKLTGCCSEVLP